MFLKRRAKKRIATPNVSPIARAARFAVESLENRVLLTSTGLAGAYFNNPTLTGSPVATRIDKTVNFVWSGAPGVTGVSADNFSVRWTGQVNPLYTGLYYFTTRSDDGVRLFINGAKIIDNWTPHASMLNSGSVTLTAGQKANITMEFFDAAYSATAQLYWQSKSQAQQIVPESALSNNYVPPAPPPAVPATPASFTASALSTSQIKLTWQDVSTETLYKLERTADGATNWTQIATPPANSTSYTDGNLAASTKYYYRLRANNGAGDSAYTPVASATTQAVTPPPPTAPATPSSFAASALSASQVKLSWQDVANESLYKLERSPDGANGWTQIATPAANATTYTDSNLPASSKFFYRLRANNSAGDSAYTAVASATTQAVTPPPPPGSGDGLLGAYFDNMDFTAQSFARVDPQINFNWGYNAPTASMGVDSFSVRWTGQVQAQKSETYTFYTKSDDGVKLFINGQLVIDKLIVQSTTEYAASVAMVAGQKYSIQLDYIERAGGANASLSWSSPTTPKQLIPQSQLFSGGVVTPPPPTAPATPASFAASPLSASQIKLTWQDVSNESLYKIERSSDGATNWTQIATPAANATSYTDSSLAASTTYYYRLRANNSAGDSAYTPVASATTQAITPPPPGSTYQPDALIQIHGETTFVGDNIYNTTGAGQAKTSTGDFYPRPFQIRVYNDGTAPDSFLITGPAGDGFQGNWRYQYYDSFVFGWNGAREITDAITGAGWNTGNIDPGQYRDFRIEILAPTAPGGAKITVNLVATSIHDPSKSDVVQAIMANPINRAVAIRRQNFDAGGTYLMTIQNQGNLPDSFTINAGLGAGVGSTWNAQFFDDQFGGNDITAAAKSAAGWQTRVLQPWESQEFRVVFTGYTDPSIPSVQITAASVVKPDTKQQTTVTISKPQPFPVSAATDVFPIAVWTQPVASFDKWQARGVNTLMDYQGDGATIEQWSQAARDRGMYYIRKPLANPALDIGDKNLLAWALPDEPEIRTVPASTYAQWRANWNAIDPTRPILENFSGGYVIGWQGAKTSNDYIPYLNNVDWVSSSIYPVTAWNRPQTAGGGLDASGRVIDRLEQWSGGKPAWAVIEMDDQELPYGPRDLPSPTAGQFRATVWDSVIHGARGVVYFPESFNPAFKFDNTPNDVAAEMPKVAAKLQSIAAPLLSDIDPVTRGLQVDGPLEGTWRIYNGQTYYVVLNFSEQTVTKNITLQGVDPASPVTVNGESRTLTLSNSTLTDTFAPFEVHVYQVG